MKLLVDCAHLPNVCSQRLTCRYAGSTITSSERSGPIECLPRSAMFSRYSVHMLNRPSPRAADIVIRPYQEADRLEVRRICADTGFLGQPIDPIFEDRELFVDYLTDYYLGIEPYASLGCDFEGSVLGYLLGCCRPLAK